MIPSLLNNNNGSPRERDDHRSDRHCGWVRPTDLICCRASALRSMLAHVKLIVTYLVPTTYSLKLELSNVRGLLHAACGCYFNHSDSAQCSCVLVSASPTPTAGMLHCLHQKCRDCGGQTWLLSSANNFVAWSFRTSKRRASTSV